MEILGDVIVEGEYNPQAIKDYLILDKEKSSLADLKLKAKQHLAAVGWSFHYVSKKDKHGKKRELRYCPPIGRKYISLKTACEAYLNQLESDGGGLEEVGKNGSKRVKGNIGGQVDEVGGSETKRGYFGNLLEGNYGWDGLGEYKVNFVDSFNGENVSFKGLGLGGVEGNGGLGLGGVEGNGGGETDVCGSIQVDLAEKEEVVTDTSKLTDQLIKDNGVKRIGKRVRFLDTVTVYGGENQEVDEQVGGDVNFSSATLRPGGRIHVDLTENEKIVPDSNGLSTQIKERGVKKMGKKRNNSDDDDDDYEEFQPPKRIRIVTENKRAKSILYSLIEHKLVPPLAIVHYRNKKDGRSMGEGRVTSEGIKCTCCERVFTMSKFEAHVGSTYHRPAANIFLEDGRSLSQCREQWESGNVFMARNMKKDQDHDQNLNDEICSICLDAGELVLCDHCPSAYHTMCLGMKEVPDSEFWYCPSCCCRICRQKMSKDDKDTIRCEQCELLYHPHCLRDFLGAKWNEKRNKFCTEKCEEVSISLQKLVGKPFFVGEENLTFTWLKNENNGVDHVGNQKKLNDALRVMHERFDPVPEPRWGRDVIQDVIFSRESDFKRLDFRGFYTLILEKDGETVCVAAVRILGEKVAEVPLVSTRFKYEKRGMCKILMAQLEKNLIDIGVQILTLPSVPDTINVWTSPSFGFSPMRNSDRLRLVNYNFLDFPGTIRCQKRLTKSKICCMK